MSVSDILPIVATAQLGVFALLSIFSRKKSTDRPLLVSAMAFLALWLVAFRPLWHSAKAEASIGAPSSNVVSCATVERDMSAAKVQQRLGPPDEKKSDEETRGPGATIWIYRDSRCAVHMFDDKVDFTE
ncbi:MAG TPA: hypothetical protein VJ853_15390 [Thermoanaerobaculia bacterium]|nr:hypothetical protein [Thermoanaerobaculia bacterium]